MPQFIPVTGVTFRTLWDCSRQNLAPDCTVYSHGLACFSTATAGHRARRPTVVGGPKP